MTDIPDFLLAVDPETGKVQWKWNTAPNKGEPDRRHGRRRGDAISHGGGMTWMTGTYDPELNLVVFGHREPESCPGGRKAVKVTICGLLFDCGGESGYGQAGVAFPAFSARYP